MKVILDTNIWISALISKDFEWIDGLFNSESCELIFSEKLLREFLVVAKRPKLKRFINEARLQQLIELFDTFAVLVVTTSTITICRDTDDNFLLELAIDSGANVLVTGDQDLLTLQRIGQCEIITIAELKRRMN